MNTFSTPAKPRESKKASQGQTGPRTAEGKARSARNAVKHDLQAQSMVLPGEDIDEYETFVKEVVASLKPAGAALAEIARQIANTLWMLRRIDFWQVTSARVSTDARSEDAQAPIREIEGQIANLRGDIACQQRDPALEVPLIVRLGERPDAELVDALEVLMIHCDLSAQSMTHYLEDLKRVCSALELPEDAVNDPSKWDGWTVGLARRLAHHVLAPSGKMLTDHISEASEEWKAGLNEQRARRQLERRRLKKEINALELRKRDLLAVQTIPEPGQQDTLVRYQNAYLLKLKRLQEVYDKMQAASRKRETQKETTRKA